MESEFSAGIFLSEISIVFILIEKSKRTFSFLRHQLSSLSFDIFLMTPSPSLLMTASRGITKESPRELESRQREICGSLTILTRPMKFTKLKT
jgi:hypothetical protein